MPLGANAILTAETNNDEIWKYTDTNADGVADKKELFTANFGRGGSMEAQPSNLFWAMDNWMYSTVNSFRIRWTPNGVIREATGPSSSQWGATQDNDGKVWFQHGASGLPGYFQFPVHYGNFAHPDQFEPNLEIVWPRAASDRRRPSRVARHTNAGRDGDLRDGCGGQCHLPWPPAAERPRRRLHPRRNRRAIHPSAAAGRHRGADATDATCIRGPSSSGRSIRCSARWVWPTHPTAPCTSPTCTAA